VVIKEELLDKVPLTGLWTRLYFGGFKKFGLNILEGGCARGWKLGGGGLGRRGKRAGKGSH